MKAYAVIIVPLIAVAAVKPIASDELSAQTIGKCDRCGRPFKAQERHCPCGFNLWAQRAGT